MRPYVTNALFSVLALLALLAGACSDAPSSAASSAAGPRLVTLGGDVTEIVYALGAGGQVAGADLSSAYPPEVLELPRLNYHRQMSAESVLSLEPDLVLLTAEAGPPGAIEQLRSAVEVVTIPGEVTAAGVPAKIRAVASAIDRAEAGEQLIAEYESALAAAKETAAATEERPRVIFLYARQGMGAPMVGGMNSGADEMIELAGGVNAASDLEGFQPLTPEALPKLAPDAILMLDKGFEALGGERGLLDLPGMAETPAGRTKTFVTLPDDLLMSFGPRTPEALERLTAALHPEAIAEGGQ